MSDIDLEQVGNDAIVGDMEDRSLRVFVDGNDHFTVLHTGEVLNGTGDAHCYVELLQQKTNLTHCSRFHCDGLQLTSTSHCAVTAAESRKNLQIQNVDAPSKLQHLAVY